MDDNTLKNYKAINELVLNSNFYLTEESKKLFSSILFNQQHADEYAKIAASPDKRLFFDYAGDYTYLYDEFKILSGVDFSYQEFIDNRCSNGEKLLKHIKDIYYIPSNIHLIFEYLRSENDFSSYGELFKCLFPSKYEEHKNDICFDSNVYICYEEEKVKITFNKVDNGRITFKKHFHDKEYISKITPFVDKIIVYFNTKFISMRDKKNLKICLSLNYADWLLASTKNNWTSCLSLESGYGYWKGLAGLVGDKNRIMIFTTDMTEKEFLGVKSYKMIERMWAFTMSKFDTTYLHCNLMYPRKVPVSDSVIKEVMKGVLPDSVVVNPKKEISYISKYSFPLIFQEENDDVFSSSIYEDTLSKIPISKTSACYTTDSSHKVFSYTKQYIDETDFETIDSSNIVDNSDEFYEGEKLEKIKKL